MQVISHTVPPKLSYLINRSWFSTIQEKFLKLVELKFTICLKNRLMKYLKNYRYFSNASHYLLFNNASLMTWFAIILHRSFHSWQHLGKLGWVENVDLCQRVSSVFVNVKKFISIATKLPASFTVKTGKGFCRGELIPIKIAFFSGNLSVYGCL